MGGVSAPPFLTMDADQFNTIKELLEAISSNLMGLRIIAGAILGFLFAWAVFHD